MRIGPTMGTQVDLVELLPIIKSRRMEEEVIPEEKDFPSYLHIFQRPKGILLPLVNYLCLSFWNPES